MSNSSSSRRPYPDDARALKTLNRMLENAALKPPRLKNKHLISAKISDVAQAGLRHIAKEHGYVHGGHGNISMLLEAIGTGTLNVTRSALVPHHLD